MQRSSRKKMSITKLTLARIKYIRENYFQFVTGYIKKRLDIDSPATMNRDTMIIEVGVEVLFKAICGVMEIPTEEADKLAIEAYSKQTVVPDKFVDKLADYVELEADAERLAAITPEDRKKAVDEYRSKRNQEISSEWDEHV